MNSHWPTDLNEDGTAPANVVLVASGDGHLSRQAIYQLQAGMQLQKSGFEVAAFQVPLVGKMIRITMPIVATRSKG